MIKWFKKNKKEETKKETKWTYTISVDNVPENDLTPIQYGTLKTGYVEDIIIPRIGERICCQDWSKILSDNKNNYIYKGILEYTGIVTDVFYNYHLKIVNITFDCKEVRKTWK